LFVTKYILLHIVHIQSRDSSVCIATGRTTGVQFLAGKRDFSLLHSFRTASGVHPSSYPQLSISPGVKRLGLEDDHSSPSSIVGKNVGAIPPLPIRRHGLVPLLVRISGGVPAFLTGIFSGFSQPL
jgi:hypothetical protein